jgi:transcriptional regulator with XRE-family HTH domain
MPYSKEIIYKIIGEKIRNERENLSLNQEKLSNIIGVSRSSVSNIETGRHQVPIHLLFTLSKKLDIELNQLIPSNDEIAEYLKSHIDGDFNLILKEVNLSSKELKSIQNTLENIK